MVAWDESVAPLSPRGQQLCQQLGQWAVERAAPALPATTASASPAPPSRRLARAALWREHARLAAAADARDEPPAGVRALRDLDERCAEALAHVQRASSCFELVAQRHAGLEAQAGALQAQTAAHSMRLAGLTALSESLEARLGPFRAVATHRRLLESAGLAGTHPDLFGALAALDQAIADVRAAPSAAARAESVELLAELRSLQAKGLRAVGAHVSGAVHAACTAAAVSLRDWYAAPDAPAALLSPEDGAFGQAAHARFHGLAASLRPHVEALERAAARGREALPALLDAHAGYLAARAPLLRAALGAMLARLARAGAADAASAALAAAGGEVGAEGALGLAGARLSSERLADAARRAVGWFRRVASLECELHALFFKAHAHAHAHAAAAAAAAHLPHGGGGSGGLLVAEGERGGAGMAAVAAALDEALERSLGGVCALLAAWLRPAVLAATQVEALADLALALREEANSARHDATVEGELGGAASAGRSGGALAVAAAVERVLGDVQIRLAFRAQVEIRDTVATFRPSAHDLDYPARLEKARDEALARAQAARAAAAATATAYEVGGGGSDGDVARSAAAAAFASSSVSYEIPWYPPAEAALRCLAVLYRAVDRLTFTSLAHEAVLGATDALLAGASRVKASSGELHGRLFLARQLLTLREQLAPFDADWEVVEKTLDLTSMNAWLLAELRSRRALARPFAFVRSIFTSNRPNVVERHADAKAALEVELKTACEGLIALLSEQLTEPLLPFLASHAHAGADDDAAADAPLPSVDECAAALTQTVSCVESRLPGLYGALSLYLCNPVTLAILFRPVKAAVSDALQQYGAVARRALPDAQRDELDISGQLGRMSALLDSYG